MHRVSKPHFGPLLREWRQRHSLSQLDLALDAEISQKHLSFIESGRSCPSRSMVLRLAEALKVPLRERNALLVSAGYASAYPVRPIDDPELRAARAAINLLLKGHEPFPAIAVDRHWNMLASNAAVMPLLSDIDDAELLLSPVNVLRLSLHPKGLAPRIANLPIWREHLLKRLKDQAGSTGDPVLVALLAELRSYPEPAGRQHLIELPIATDVFVPLVLMTPAGPLSFFSTMTVFGSPNDVTLSEIAIEAFFPADEGTRQILMAT